MSFFFFWATGPTLSIRQCLLCVLIVVVIVISQNPMVDKFLILPLLLLLLLLRLCVWRFEYKKREEFKRPYCIFDDWEGASRLCSPCCFVSCQPSLLGCATEKKRRKLTCLGSSPFFFYVPTCRHQTHSWSPLPLCVGPFSFHNSQQFWCLIFFVRFSPPFLSDFFVLSHF